ncbi:MAG: response regulator [Gammaproteobacteria bacterium]
MAHRSALIVDDSRTARAVLASVLEKHAVAVDMAESAEDALERLGHTRPDVIFMDHQMPGMDGLQAVQAIKANPTTATIPIMMYTSQEGELYVGQARALGAVGVLPKQIKPVEVSALLESLHLIPPQPADDIEVEIIPPEDAANATSGDQATPSNGDWPEMHRWLEQVLDQHGQDLRLEIEKTMQRLLDEQTAEHGPPRRRRTDNLRWWQLPLNWVIVALALVAGVLVWLQLDSQQDLAVAAEKNAALAAELEAQRALGRDNDQLRDRLDAEIAVQDGQFDQFVSALEWTANQSAPYAADEVPLGDQRLQIIDGLVQRLLSVGFTGTIEVASHMGDFCYRSGGGGELEPAPGNTPVPDCDQVGLPRAAAQQAASRQSVAFANYLAALENQDLSPVRVIVDSFGNSQPRYTYPIVTQGTTAGEWNSIARRNNRVEIRLVPE